MTDLNSFSDLVKIIARLRAPDGCPWDRAQTHVSLRPYVLEEAHEVIAAIDAGEPTALADELGDVLLQVLLHSQIATEEDQFTIDDVIDGLSRKMIRRHPHVFAGTPSDMESVHRSWEDIKSKERSSKTALPTLLAARKLISRLGMLPNQITQAEFHDEESRAGGIILASIARVMNQGVDPEIALRRSIDYFANNSARD